MDGTIFFVLQAYQSPPWRKSCILYVLYMYIIYTIMLFWFHSLNTFFPKYYFLTETFRSDWEGKRENKAYILSRIFVAFFVPRVPDIRIDVCRIRFFYLFLHNQPSKRKREKKGKIESVTPWYLLLGGPQNILRTCEGIPTFFKLDSLLATDILNKKP